MHVTSKDAPTEGLDGIAQDIVTSEMTAEQVGSGDVAVLATPVVVALVERAAVQSLAGRLPDGETSVGASIELAHLAPTPVGARVSARTRLEHVEGDRRLTFSFTVEDPAGEIASGTHVRVVVDRQRFEETAAKRSG
jgi:fluoroacetyl-CoA thioesterase